MKWILSVLILAMMAMPIQADYGKAGHKGKRGHMSHIFQADRLKKELNLSELQLQSVNQINLRQKETYKRYKDQLSPIRDKIKAERDKEPVDYARLRVLMETASPIKIDLMIAKQKHKDAIKAVLTDKQKKKLKKLIKKKHRKKKRQKKDKN